MSLQNNIKELAGRYHTEVTNIRRHLHQHPELSYQEKETSAYVQSKLKEYDIPFQKDIADNGIAAMIEGSNATKKVIALRADMDALPITEENDVSYKSQNEGVMHACGHDVHTASLLGAARILNDIKNKLEGSIKLIFQPAEEKFPGGASLMIKDGVLENPAPAGIIGQHVHPLIPVGTVGFREGMSMASADELYLTVKGIGGHGAVPNTAIDPILITAHIITALQQVVSRNANPLIPTVLTLGKINSTGGATNVIPYEVKVEGTFRTLNEEWRFEAHRLMQKIASGVAESMGGSAELYVNVGYPFLINDAELTQRCRQAAIEYMGEENVLDIPIRMTAEDFAYFSQVTKGCFYRLGTRNEKRGLTSPVHTPTFDIDEDALQTGMGLMAWLAVKEVCF